MLSLSPRPLVDDLWFWIPIIAILALLVGAFTEWLKYRTRQDELGTSTRALDTELTALREDVETREAALRARIETLEAIVTSEAWDRLQAEEAGRPEPLLRTHERDVHPASDAEESDAERAARIARRLRS